MNYFKKHGEIALLVVILVTIGLFGVSRLLPDMGMAQKILMLSTLIFWIIALGWCLFKTDFPFFRRHKQQIGLSLLVIYTVILALATVSEVMELGWFDWL